MFSSVADINRHLILFVLSLLFVWVLVFVLTVVCVFMFFRFNFMDSFCCGFLLCC